MELETEGKSRAQGRLTAALGVCLLFAIEGYLSIGTQN